MDHLHPRAGFTPAKLRAAEISSDQVPFYRDVRNWNTILNLSLLGPNENQSKNEMPLHDWVVAEAKRRNVSGETVCADLNLPQQLDQLAFSKLPDFIEERKKVLGEKLRALLSFP